MALADVRDRLQPALLDRLTDDAPTERRESDDARVMSKAQLRRAVLRDLVTAIHAYEKLDYGMVGINEWMPVTPEAPFGGMKASGIGRESGTEGMHEYLESKAVYIGGL